MEEIILYSFRTFSDSGDNALSKVTYWRASSMLKDEAVIAWALGWTLGRRRPSSRRGQEREAKGKVVCYL